MKNLIKKILREETFVNPNGDKLKTLLFKMIDNAFEGTDIYMYDGNIWAIFTDDMRWCFQIENNGHFSYNYRFFDDIFKLLSLDVRKNEKYIIQWVEKTIPATFFLRNPTVGSHFRRWEVEDVIRIGKKLNKE